MSEDGHNYTFGQWPEAPWKKKMKYKDKLQEGLTDNKNVVQELLLFWIGLMLAGILVFVILGYVQ